MSSLKKCDHCQAKGELLRCVCLKAAYCDAACQKAGWKEHKPDCPPFVRKPAPGKGFGLFATRSFKAGQIIATESAIIIVPFTFDPECHVESVLKQFQSLSHEDQNCILSFEGNMTRTQVWSPIYRCREQFLKSMYNFHGGEEKVRKIINVYHNNRCQLQQGGAEGSFSFLFLIQIQMNHSCAHNTKDMFDPQTGLHTHTAVRRILKGTELTEKYSFCGFPHLSVAASKELSAETEMGTREERSKGLKFTCLCEICSLTGAELEENEKVRKQIKELYVRFKEIDTQVMPPNVITHNDHYRAVIGDWFDVADEIMRLFNLIPDQFVTFKKKIGFTGMELWPHATMVRKVPAVPEEVYKEAANIVD